MSPEEREYGARLFGALASPGRLRIVERLAQGPASVTEIAAATALKQSMTSQHLATLLGAGVVVHERQGSARIYSLRGPRIARIVHLVEEFYDAHLAELRELVERE
jgi:DNA-binding transcriptional ArsR family regulator